MTNLKTGFRVMLTHKEYEALRMSHADAFCTIEMATDTSQPWKYRAVFEDGEAITKAYRSVRDREPMHAAISLPYKSICKKLAILVLGDR